MVNNRLTVLVVDDEKAICELVCQGLTEYGYVCKAALNADDALDKLKSHNFYIVLVDIVLPGMSGLDLLKKIKELCPTSAIVMITAVNDLSIVVEAMKLGASDYIIKPFTFDQINTSISTILEKRSPHHTTNKVFTSVENVDDNDNTHNRSFSRINAIAYGVDAQIDLFDSHSKLVTKRTVELARWLGLPEKEIEKWVVERTRLYNERDRKITVMLKKLGRNALVQVMLGLTRVLYYVSKPAEELN